MLKKKCETCGTDMVFPDWKQFRKRRFCSNKCRGKWTVKIQTGKVPWNKGKKGNYTEKMREKMSEGRKKYFREHPEARRAITERQRGKTTSLKQKEAVRKTGLMHKKEKNPNWKGGTSPMRKLLEGSNEYKRWREQIFKRDNWTCQNCGNRGGKLHAHHMKSFAEFPELRLDLNNGLTVCEKCHYEIHSHQSWFSKEAIQKVVKST